jgi:3-oxoacyl-[acyl-carrier protein] reductase
VRRAPGAGLVDSLPVGASSRAVLVTGGSRSIGRAIARAFADRGDRVAVHFGTSRERAEAVLAELPGRGHVLVQADMADAGSVGAMVDSAADALGGLDVPVDNAGVLVASPPAAARWSTCRAAGRSAGSRRTRPTARRRPA